MHIHARSLKYFDMIRRCGSIREAARRLHVASSAINRQLIHLEEEVGAELFERLPSGLKLTAAGEVFARHVITVLQDEQRVLSELEGLRGIRRGEVSVLAAEGLSSDFLPVVLQRMHGLYPLVRMQVKTRGSPAIPRAIADGDADLGLGFQFDPSPELHQLAVGRFAIGAVVPASHPLASLPHVNFAECARYPLVLSQPELSIHRSLEPILRRHKRPLTILTQTDSIHLMKSLSLRGLGVSFLTQFSIEQERSEGLLVHVPLHSPHAVTSELGVYVRAGRSLPPALDAFIRIVTEELERREASEIRPSTHAA